MTSGIRTSEFWFSVVAFLAGVFVASGVLPNEHWSVKLAGALLAGLGALGYGISRGLTKGGSGPTVLLPLALAAGLSLTLAGCCSTTRCYLARGLTAVAAADKLAAPALDRACTAKIKACGAVPPESCPPFKLCTGAATSYQVAMDAIGRALAACNKALADVGIR